MLTIKTMTKECSLINEEEFIIIYLASDSKSTLIIINFSYYIFELFIVELIRYYSYENSVTFIY